jgi:hypothetical protein
MRFAFEVALILVLCCDSAIKMELEMRITAEDLV